MLLPKTVRLLCFLASGLLFFCCKLAGAQSDEELPPLSMFVESAARYSAESLSNALDLKLAGARVTRAWSSLAPRVSVTGNLTRNEFDQT
ncbi:MAG: hypothetical protein AAFX94_14145, partial [Myxococcota bacterium]